MAASRNPGVVVLDAGSGQTKVGLAGEDEPRCVFSTIVGRHRDQTGIQNGSRSAAPNGDRDIYIGNEAQKRRAVLALEYPVRRGVITNWDDMERLWRYAFNELHLPAATEHAVLLTEPPLNPRINREKTAQIMFEKFQTAALYFGIPGVLALYTSGRTSGVVLDCGEGLTQVVPIYEGCALTHAIRKQQLAGEDVTEYLTRLLAEAGCSFETSAQREEVREIKEKLCYVATDYDRELAAAEWSEASMRKSYRLPDGKEITVGPERFRCPEALFQPAAAFVDLEMTGIQQTTFSAITKCDLNLRKTLYANLVVAGGSTLFPGFVERLRSEVAALAPAAVKLEVTAPANRQNAVWTGAAILATLSTFRQSCVTRKDYSEKGFRAFQQM